jgi:hypothetical protein
MKVTKISKESAAKEISEKRVKGQYQTLFEEINKTGESRKVEELTRGQIAALYRAAQVAELQVRANYKGGYVVLSPRAKE